MSYNEIIESNNAFARSVEAQNKAYAQQIKEEREATRVQSYSIMIIAIAIICLVCYLVRKSCNK